MTFSDRTTRMFNAEEYEDDVRVIINFIMDDASCDTSMMTYKSMWVMALDIAKKREDYAPKRKHKKEKLKSFDIATVAATAAAAATATATAAATATATTAAATAAGGADDAGADEAKKDDAELVELDKKAQKMRSDLKKKLSSTIKKRKTLAKKGRNSPPKKQMRKKLKMGRTTRMF